MNFDDELANDWDNIGIIRDKDYKRKVIYKNKFHARTVRNIEVKNFANELTYKLPNEFRDRLHNYNHYNDYSSELHLDENNYTVY